MKTKGNKAKMNTFVFNFAAPILSYKIGSCQAFFNNLFFVRV